MVEFLSNTGDKIAALILAFMAGLGGFGANLQTSLAPKGNVQTTAAAYEAAPPSGATTSAAAAETSSISLALASVTPNLLPAVSSSWLATGTPAIVLGAKVVAPSTVQKKPAQKILAPIPATPPPTAPVTPPITITASSLLAATTISFKERFDGYLDAEFNADLGGGNVFSWNAGDTTIGGGSLPSFSTSLSCNPSSDIPAIDSPDQNPIFHVRTSYACDISFAAVTGDDRRTQSRTINASTPPGNVMIQPAPSMNTVLANDTNNGGFVFTNNDSEPITITGVTFDVSYTALSTLNGPLVLRFLDPASGQSLIDYHLESLPQTSASTLTNSGANLSVSFAFTIPANTQKMLGVQILGVERMLIPNDNPTVNVTLDSATTNHSEVTTDINAPTITWTCTIPMTAYDPNATDTTEQVCKG